MKTSFLATLLITLWLAAPIPRLSAADPEPSEEEPIPQPGVVTPPAVTPEPVPPAEPLQAVPPVPALPPALRGRTNVGAVPTLPTPPAIAPRITQPAPGLAPQPGQPTPAPSLPVPTITPGAPAGPTLPGGTTLGGAIAPGTTNAPGKSPDGTYAPGVLTLQMADLEVVLTLYAELTQRTVLRATALPKVQIMLSNQTPWTPEEAVQALDTVLAMNGIAMVNIGDKFVSAVPANTVLQEGAAFARGDLKDLAETGQFVTKILKLKHVLPSEVQQVIASFAKTPNGILAIDSTQTIVLRDYPANVKRMSELIEQLDVEVENDYKLEVIPIRYGMVTDIYNTMSSLVGGAAGGAAPAAGGAVARTTGIQRTPTGRGARTPMGGFGAGGIGGYGGYGGYGTTPLRPGGYYPQDAATAPLEREIQAELEAGQYRPQQAAATPVNPAAPRAVTTPTTAASTFNQRFQQILSRAGQQAGPVQLLQDARIVPDERSNSLIVFANKQDMKMITNIVAKVDQLMAQVVIDAIIMDVQLSDSYSLGVSWLMQPQRSGNWTQAAGSNTGNLITSLTNIAGSSGFTYLAKYRDDLNVAVSALAGKNRGQILARPRIQTTHATPASFSVGETVPFISGTYQGGSIYGPSAYFSQLSVDTTLDVTPFITPDDLVVMEITQQISEISGFEEFPGVGKQPRTINRSASSTISVRDGETVVLGGYIRASKSKTSSGVPLLKDIPLLGALFRSKSSDAKRSELIVLIRPTILRTPEDAAREAEATRDRLPGIRDMEQSIEKEENTGARLNTLFGK